MFYFHRSTLNALEELSCTDLGQSWGKLKKDSGKLYEPRPISDSCHFKKAKRAYVDVSPVASTDELNSFFLSTFMGGR